MVSAHRQARLEQRKIKDSKEIETPTDPATDKAPTDLNKLAEKKRKEIKELDKKMKKLKEDLK